MTGGRPPRCGGSWSSWNGDPGRRWDPVQGVGSSLRMGHRSRTRFGAFRLPFLLRLVNCPSPPFPPVCRPPVLCTEKVVHSDFSCRFVRIVLPDMSREGRSSSLRWLLLARCGQHFQSVRGGHQLPGPLETEHAPHQVVPSGDRVPPVVHLLPLAGEFQHLAGSQDILDPRFLSSGSLTETRA